MKKRATLILMTAITLATGCAVGTTGQPNLRQAPANGLEPVQVHKDIRPPAETGVRWGGTILSVEHQIDETWIEILKHELYPFGKPNLDRPLQRRFFARFAGFLDPHVYVHGREITVSGNLKEGITQDIDEHDAVYPVVEADVHHLWHPGPIDRHYYRYDHPYFYHDFYFLDPYCLRRHRFSPYWYHYCSGWW